MGAGRAPDNFVLSSPYFIEGCANLPPEVGVGELRTSISTETLYPLVRFPGGGGRPLFSLSGYAYVKDHMFLELNGSSILNF